MFNRVEINLILFCIISAFTLSACSDKEEELTQIETCVNHYRAESYKAAEQECELAAEQDSAKAEWLLANIYRFNLLEERVDLVKAFQWYLAAAKHGHTDAMREVGQAYLFASGVEEDLEQAHFWLLKAANKFDAEAQFSMGVLFLEGKGQKKDLGSAVSWFKRAASQSHTMSINNLAWVFATSKNNAYNSPKKANYWITRLDDEHLKVSMFLDTQAAVFAALHQFEKAIELQNSAISQLPQETTESDLLEYQKHLESYQQGEAWYEDF